MNTQQTKALSDREKADFFELYNKGIHRTGRLWLAFNVLLLIATPFAFGAILNAMPDLGGVWKGLLTVSLVYIPSSIVEYLIYVPMLGPGASYLAFITGNLSNLKVPCAVNARDIAKTEIGTPENEVISTLSVATSSLVTVVIIALGVLLLQPLQPILTNPQLTPAFDNVVPALFGALGLKYFLKGKKFAAIPLLFSSLLCIFVPAAISQTSILLIPIGGMSILIAFIFFKKGWLK